MSFTMMGTRGSVKHRITPKGYGRGPRGEVGKSDRLAYVKAKLDAGRTFDFAKPKSETGVFKTAMSKVKGLFARGDR